MLQISTKREANEINFFSLYFTRTILIRLESRVFFLSKSEQFSSSFRYRFQYQRIISHKNNTSLEDLFIFLYIYAR